MTQYRKNIFAIIEWPMIIVAWILLAVGLAFHLLGLPALFVGSWVGTGLLFASWWPIHRRAEVTAIEKQRPKREHKNPVYRKPRGREHE